MKTKAILFVTPRCDSSRSKVIFLLIFLLAAFVARSQNDSVYQSFFGDDSTRWTVSIEYGADADPLDYDFRTIGDTVIDSVAYKKVVGLEFNRPQRHQIIYCFMRENRETGQLWIRNSFGVEYLVCDMSLSVGDTFISTFLYYNIAGELDTFVVEEIVYRDGRKHIQLWGPDQAFDEGIGSVYMFDACDFEYYNRSEILCVYKDGTHIYQNPYHSRCRNYWYGETSSPTIEKITVYPNPCEIVLQITNIPVPPKIVYATDVAGHRFTLPTDGFSVHTSGLASGWYELTIITLGKTYSSSFLKL